ncbi:hypothetical protein HPULCUR_003912 [Helicostylum pulchrum]|uniref:FYVE-type domain-containing protein n=1 Tax=Helicostylum pulchrum TaxID=562976 RepID=A0ABP9XUP5_9FUNG
MNTKEDYAPLILPRPVWVNDMDVSYCSSCNNAFGPLKRRHHCRNCGNIFCHECSSRKVPLPQLGDGTKPVRVCNGCFDVAYLVTYALDVDHGISTQIHGVRGLLELTEKDDEKDLHNMVAYGGVDSLIWLCRTSKSIKLHHLTTTILAMLAEKESIRPVIITKWALPPLLYLIRHYTNAEMAQKKSPANSIRSSNTDNNQSDEISANETRQSIILEIIINCTHILYLLSRAGILSQKEVVTEGVFDTLCMLASFDQVNFEATTEEKQQINERQTIIQNVAAKAISAISSLVSFQASIIELIQNSKTLPSLLRSRNNEVRKYMAKTVAYLSLRNEKYKPNLLYGDGSRALVSILVVLPLADNSDKQMRTKDLYYYLSRQVESDEEFTAQGDDQTLNAAAVSHACCALANFATNNESQVNLMSQPRLLKYICNVPTVFPKHDEIHRHVARFLANLALYEENSRVMLTNKNRNKRGEKDAYNVLPTLLYMGRVSPSGVRRQVVRAIDNLNSKGDSRGLFNDAYSYIRKILRDDDGNEKDIDTIKRAKSIIAREKLEAEKPVKEVVSSTKNTTLATPEVTIMEEEEVIQQEEAVSQQQQQQQQEEALKHQEEELLKQQENELSKQQEEEALQQLEKEALQQQEEAIFQQQEEALLESEEETLRHQNPVDILARDKVESPTLSDPVIVSSSTEGDEVEEPKSSPPLPTKNKRKSKRNRRSD